MLTLGLIATAPVASAASGRAIDLLPHEAEYELKLIRSDQNANIQDVRGIFRYGISGSDCDGYTVNVELSNRIVDKGGNVTQVDQFTKSFEDPNLGVYSFEERQEINGRTVEQTKGEAEILDGAVKVKLSETGNDEPKQATIVSGARFPVQFMMDTIEAARAGDLFFRRHYYDGSDGGTVAFEASGMIGKKVEGSGTLDGGFAVASQSDDAWRIILAYFKETPDAPRSDTVPNYQISFTLFDNGVSSDLEIDYGDFVISGDMTSFESLPKGACPQ